MPGPDAAPADAAPYPPAAITVGDAEKLDPSLYERAAEAGDMEAAFRLGLVYWGHKKFGRANHWWHVAADHGHVPAMYWLAHSADSRSFVPGRTVRLLTRAAEAGSVDAMVDLGKHWDDALRDDHHRPEAARWWTAAAEAGRVDAMVRVAELATDRDQALPWLRRATDLDPVPPDTLTTDEKRDLAFVVLGGAALIADMVSG